MDRGAREIEAGAALVARLGKGGAAHKYDHGHALILCGPMGKTGAARLAARGALRIGAGLVTLGVAHSALGEAGAQVSAVMLAQIGDEAALAQVLADARINAICLGPGFGIARAGAFLPGVLAAKRGCVLDADALSALADAPQLCAQLHGACVLTPHMGEFARLFPDLAARIGPQDAGGALEARIGAVREAAARLGCILLLKGSASVIAGPDGRAFVHNSNGMRAAPWLATAGSGDVLAGMIAGLIARGFAPLEAAQAGVWLHVEAARSFGPGLIAEDLPEMLPKVFAGLGV
ncbi:MAG: NAD(P)H-hydrate dehydratase [Paracoccaceae bacterium]